MRFLLILIVLVPGLMAARTLGLFRDWFVLREWAQGRATGMPTLHEPVSPTVNRAEATLAAWRKFVSSALLTAAFVCFSFAGALALFSGLGWI